MDKNFKYQTEKFADIKILRYQVDGFSKLSLRQKKLIYFLSQAALAGRDILWDQNNAFNLQIRRTLETIFTTYRGDRTDQSFQNFLVYLKRVWFSNGIHHHYSMDKIAPGFTKEYFCNLVEKSDFSDCPTVKGKSFRESIKKLIPILFDKEIASKRVYLDSTNDLIENSANNYFKDITQEEAEKFYASFDTPQEERPSYGLNSRLVKENGVILEKIWKAEGLYGKAIKEIINWLLLAVDVAENDTQKEVIKKLIQFYKTGDLKQFDEYSILWVKDTESHVDFVNGFIEVYGDALGIKASWESIVNFKDLEATKRTEIVSKNAQWFEDHSPVDSKFKKKSVKGVSAKVIIAAILGGDCHPSTPIGINLPNADWIREGYGSKSVTIENITRAYYQVSLTDGMLEEFAWDQQEVQLSRDFGYLANNLHTDLHECLGHGSGQLLQGVKADALKNYGSTIEETRADLFALYYIMDEKLVKLGLIPSLETGKAEYTSYIRNGLLTQLVRIEPGKDIEESHMRNRQIIAKWAYENGKEANIIEKKVRKNKTYFKINDYEGLRRLFGQLLHEVQRIKSEGDYDAALDLVEKYGVKTDKKLHAEVLNRYKKLDLAPYAGFINPEYTPIFNKKEIIDVAIHYPDDFTQQMLHYSENYSFLPLINN